VETNANFASQINVAKLVSPLPGDSTPSTKSTSVQL